MSYAISRNSVLAWAALVPDDLHTDPRHVAMPTATRTSPADRPQGIDRPSLTLLGAEPWRAAFEFVAHKLARTSARPEGDGHPVVLFPGLGTDGAAVAPLRKHCAALGYSAFDWGEGRNTGPRGDVNEWLAALAMRTSASLSGFDQSATLIGWSLGGLYARELGKLLEPQVRQVITIGTPFNATADHTNVGWLYRLLGGSPASFDAELSARLKTAPPVPTTSIYSRTDGVVAWQTCVHDDGAPREVQDIEIRGSHIGMGWNAAALEIIADRLAVPPGRWRPYAATAPAALAA
jgi:pimeloyl-ACP methyl ester carboxylesterase